MRLPFAARLSASGLLLLAAAIPGFGQTNFLPRGVAEQDSSLRSVDLLVKPPHHRQHRIRAEVASTPRQQQRGLMFRPGLGADEGMLFPFAEPRVANFWMKNTLVPLDLLFIGADHRVVRLIEMATPLSEAPLSSVVPVNAVLELRGGRARELQITEGTIIDGLTAANAPGSRN